MLSGWSSLTFDTGFVLEVENVETEYEVQQREKLYRQIRNREREKERFVTEIFV